MLLLGLLSAMPFIPIHIMAWSNNGDLLAIFFKLKVYKLQYDRKSVTRAEKLKETQLNLPQGTKKADKK